ncbi:type II toxin-antitoxin system RelE/ParE family toxin [Neisseria meningitidis]|nr:type II toxin-antitoxin system RelE/ParE family toxin [Neisseria meningitidis]ADO31505.1 Plasmid maintenance system killer protein; Toxin higB-1 [Neisseria meningitidis alpha710]ADY93758.1 killer protein [Neisseria meningitidis G2136]EGC54747.1 plasmid maintenance system killer protein [Neisseria meningitidis M6190]EGC60762.1 killer protein [Neisseria meningitidis ES14902]EGC64768.1 killer protein [Neisseria meningitidis 961-5945]KID53706.1 peptidase [Neisseria meningitidis LNP27256]
MMIVSFKHKGLERFFKTGSLSGIQAGHSVKLNLLLTALNAAQTPSDMAVPSWNLHPLKGSLSGHWAVKVNGNWRLTFRFNDGNAEVVDYQDYH